MRKLGLVLALVCLPMVLGVSRCREGESLAFGRAGTTVPILIANHTVSEVTGAVTRISVAVYSTGQVEFARDAARNDLAQERQVDESTVRDLYAALSDAGAGKLHGLLDEQLATTGRSTFTTVSFFVPSLVPGSAWANTFSFGTYPIDGRAGEVWSIIDAFVLEQFGRFAND